MAKAPPANSSSPAPAKWFCSRAENISASTTIAMDAPIASIQRWRAEIAVK